MTDLTAIIKGYNKAKASKDGLTSTWRDIACYTRPFRQDIGTDTGGDTPGNKGLIDIFDTTAVDAARTYAAGCMSWMTPSESHWAAYDAPEELSEDDAVKSWYSKCTDIAREVLAASNFYSQIHECYNDDGTFGTSGMLIEEDNKGGLRFEALVIGKYAILENSRKEVDTVFIEKVLTLRQAEQEFGRENLHIDHRELLEDNQQDCEKTHTFIHCVMPRADADRQLGKLDSSNMPWASITFDLKNKKIVRESGSWEMSVAVHRHAADPDSPWGYSPAMQAMTDIRQLNHMQSYLDTLVEKQVTPPVLLPSGFKGEVDLRAGGYTYFKNKEEMPTHWPNPGNYMIGEDRTVFRATQINRAFHVELFQALSAVPLGKEMTAAEVHMRQRDRLTLFSPTFARKNTELNTPIMRRVFALLLRNGAFPPPPPNLITETPEGLPYMPDPKITYTSRLALQMKAIENEAFGRSFAETSPFFELAPETLDNYDSDAIARAIYRNNGAPEEGLRPERERDLMRQERAEAQQQAEQEMAELEEADAVSKLASSGAIAAA